MNFYLMIFLTISLIYTFDIYINHEKSIAVKFKFLISSFIILLLTIVLGFRDAMGSDYGSYFLDFIYMTEAYADDNYFKSQSLDLVYEYLSFFIVFLNLPFDYLIILIAFIFIFSIVFFSYQEKRLFINHINIFIVLLFSSRNGLLKTRVKYFIFTYFYSLLEK